MRPSQLSSILASLTELQTVRVHGAVGAARAWLIMQWVAEDRRRHAPNSRVILCPNEDAAEELALELESLSQLFLDKPLRVAHLPGWERSPYGAITPSIRTRLSRIHALSALLEDQKPDVLVTTLAASCQATLPPQALTQFTISVRAGESIDSRETLTGRLVESGYMRVETVEDPGSYSVRGDIIDVFPSNRSKPLRIELFGDEIDRIREFDVESQRAVSAEGEAASREYFIPPAREALINRTTVARVREKAKENADDRGIHRSYRDPILASLHEGVYPDASDAWAPFCFQEEATFWDYCPQSWAVIWDDELSIQQTWDEFVSEQKIAFEKNEVIAPAVSQLFPLSAALEQSIRSRKTLFLDRLEFAPENWTSLESEELPPSTQEASSLGPAHRIRVFTGSLVPTAGATPPGSSGLNENDLVELENKFRSWLEKAFELFIVAGTQGQAERVKFLLQTRSLPCTIVSDPITALQSTNLGQIQILLGNLNSGFRWPREKLAILTAAELLGTRKKKATRSSAQGTSASRNWSGLKVLTDLQVGDAVVHVDHGIGRYQGLSRLTLSGAPSDFLVLEYANKDKLYLPVYRLNVIQKYSGSGEGVALDRLGSQNFTKAKEQVRQAVRTLATDLVRLYAERKIRAGITFTRRDAAFSQFEEKFPFEETPDQLKAIEDTLSDMEAGRSMDRLICGDVGYGKTEVAIRAAFLAISSGKQVAVLVPTTVLAHQHEQSFRTRLKDYPILIESVSRFKSSKEQNRILTEVSRGKVDLIIGTHRLLSRDVQFKDLGLIIVDEEHRFGVDHKERLKTLKVNVPVLTLSATPIPRTLHMALSGIRDISLITTPPVERLPIRTYVAKFDEELIQKAIELELKRGGQVFFIHNRVQSIHEIATRIQELVPHARIVVGHGQMPEGELEKAMLSFYQKQANVLVCTTIVESGLDVPSANTILINRADTLGLAQLYQIRGRVGRGHSRAYAYLLLPAEGAITEDAKKRLEVLQKFVELGSGFSIASHDLEIRGGGDLLGPQQSGHIAAVGFDLYTELLEEAIHEIQGQPLDVGGSQREPEIKLPFPSFLGETYVPDVHQRLSLYRRLSATTCEADVQALEEELKDRFGPAPQETQNLLWLIRMKQILKRHGIDGLTVGPQKLSLISGPNGLIDPSKALALMAAKPKIYQITPDSKFVVTLACSSMRDLYFHLESLLKEVSFKVPS